MKRRIALVMALLGWAALLCGCDRSAPFEGIPNPVATIELSDGSSMRFELFLSEAPNTVANFVELANSGFYDGLSFFRIVPGALIQSGDPRGNGTGNAGYVIQGEFSENGIENTVSHTRGTISMCRQSGYDTASCQFFIMQGNYPEYNGQYAAFGRATDAQSLAAIDAIASTPVDGNYSPVGNVPTIERIRVETYGYDYEAAKMDLPKAEDTQDGGDSAERVSGVLNLEGK